MKTIGVALAVCALTTPANVFAAQLADPPTSFAIDVPEIPGGRVCRVLPLESADTSPECTAIDQRPPLSGDQAERTIGAFWLRFPTFEGSVGVSVTDRPGVGEISEESVALLRAQYAKTMSARGYGLVSPPGIDPVRSAFVEFNGARGVQFVLDVMAEGGSTRFEVYTFFQQDRTHNIVFVGPGAQRAELSEYAKRTLATMRVPRGDLRMFGKPRWQRNAHWYGVRLAPLFAAGVIVIPALWLWDRRRRARLAVHSKVP